MNLCSEECIDACDFCIHYDFNGNEQGAYTGEGFCRLHKTQADPHDTCEDFHCFKCDEGANVEEQS